MSPKLQEPSQAILAACLSACLSCFLDVSCANGPRARVHVSIESRSSPASVGAQSQDGRCDQTLLRRPSCCCDRGDVDGLGILHGFTRAAGAVLLQGTVDTITPESLKMSWLSAAALSLSWIKLGFAGLCKARLSEAKLASSAALKLSWVWLGMVPLG